MAPITLRQRRWAKVAAIGSLVVLALSLIGCSYGHKRYPSFPNQSTPRNLAIVQFDDYGKAWDPHDVQNALDLVSANSLSNNAIVLLFVHGWHHNAKAGDSNLVAFQKTLRRLEDTLATPSYADARRQLTGTSNVNVTGIYVGWRGRSLPTFFDYLTFWGRKSAAERVGAGDFREFCERLQKIYEERNSRTNSPLFMGLTLVGHSFGGQVLFNAAAQKLESSLVQQSDGFSGQTNATKTPAKSLVSGFGDLVVLINPALEANQFARIDALNRRLKYSQAQTPALLVISGEGDTARQRAFPIGRRLTRPFRPPFRPEQKELWYQPLGEYKPQRTHTLTETTSRSMLTEKSYVEPKQVLAFDFTAPTILGNGAHGGLLNPIGVWHQPYSAVVVAYTSSQLIIGHSGIFTDAFEDFLTVYVAFLEGKRALLSAERKK